ncbi:hypothetical protein QBC45DRAFT_131551 [Copromyces sp. CBS 386.78]|nr:hypothetical protein QBC45DRAFT_131551 [Copromyces sp. CBS 386.78]
MQPTRQQTPRGTAADDGSSDLRGWTTRTLHYGNAFLAGTASFPCRAFCCGPFCLGGEWSTSRQEAVPRRWKQQSHAASSTLGCQGSISRVQGDTDELKLGKLDPAAASTPLYPQPHQSPLMASMSSALCPGALSRRRSGTQEDKTEAKHDAKCPLDANSPTQTTRTEPKRVKCGDRSWTATWRPSVIPHVEEKGGRTLMGDGLLCTSG